jgi:hypothetical protein
METRKIIIIIKIMQQFRNESNMSLLIPILSQLNPMCPFRITSLYLLSYKSPRYLIFPIEMFLFKIMNYQFLVSKFNPHYLWAQPDTFPLPVQFSQAQDVKTQSSKQSLASSCPSFVNLPRFLPQQLVNSIVAANI